MNSNVAISSSRKPVAFVGLPFKLFIGVGMCFLIILGYGFVGPANDFAYPEGARAIFFHVPCAFISIYTLSAASVMAFKTLGIVRNEGNGYVATDLKCAAYMDVGLLFAGATLITGMLFSEMQWGKYWSWDPRQTSFLIVCMMFIGISVLRAGIPDPRTRARLGGVAVLIMLPLAMFLMVVLPRIIFTLHGGANNAVIGGQLDLGHGGDPYFSEMILTS